MNRAALHACDKDSKDKFHAQTLDDRMQQMRNTSGGIGFHPGVEGIDNTLVGAGQSRGEGKGFMVISKMSVGRSLGCIELYSIVDRKWTDLSFNLNEKNTFYYSILKIVVNIQAMLLE